MGLREPRHAHMLCRVRKKTLLGWGIVAGIGAAAAVLLPGEAWRTDPVAVKSSAVASGAQPPADASRFAALPSREGFSKLRRDLFAAPAPAARTASAPAHTAQAAPAPAPVVAPPMPYRVAGQVVRNGVPQVVLARDDRVLIVREGEVLEGGYRVESVKADGVTLLYTPLDIREHLAFTPVLPSAAPRPVAAVPPAAVPAPAADARAVQLRWEGPEQVRAGSNFNVALKITSHQPVRGSPLQLSYDAKLLEPVAVRAGDFFADGSFTYRVNPGGSIFVGAFTNGGVAADAEFLVVTFKPIRSGATAELTLSSMVLQGAAGRALLHEPLGAFRTSITQ
jgi:hypothetical protein